MSGASIALIAAVAVVIGAGVGFLRGRSVGSRSADAQLFDLQSEMTDLRRRLEATRRSADERDRSVRAILDALADGILVLDASGRVVAHNELAAAWFDFGDRSGAGATLMSAVGSAALSDLVLETLAGEAPPSVANEVRVDDRLFRVGVAPTGDGRVVVALRDDTELHRLARARRDLLANMSHDLRTPLASLVLLVEMLLEQDKEGPTDELVGRVREQVDTLRLLADALVDINVLESGRALLRLEPVLLGEIVSAAVEALRPQVDRAGIHMEVRVDDRLTVLADRSHLVRVFTNLLDNALRYSPQGGRVTVQSAAADEPDRVRICVSDQGPGISVADAQRVFERFYRADPSRSGSGRGLGLAIARHVVEGHGGRIWVDATSRTGATVCFTLPRADE